MTEPLDVPLSRLGPYEIEGKLAEGGMASVYVARKDPAPARAATGAGPARVALKMIRQEFVRNREFLDMFVDEAKIVARLRHANIVRTFEQGSIDGHAFIAMELLSGQSLWSVWDACRARGVRLRYDMIAWIGARVAEGLGYAHELRDDQGSPLGIVHRDINPSNVFVTRGGEIKIIDFGLAKAANRASRTATGVIKGKVSYMSPEQAAGEPVDGRSDIFALAVTLWELACDRRLFKGEDDIHTLRRVRAAKVPDPTALVAGFPAPLWAILSRALVHRCGIRARSRRLRGRRGQRRFHGSHDARPFSRGARSRPRSQPRSRRPRRSHLRRVLPALAGPRGGGGRGRPWRRHRRLARPPVIMRPCGRAKSLSNKPSRLRRDGSSRRVCGLPFREALFFGVLTPRGLAWGERIWRCRAVARHAPSRANGEPKWRNGRRSGLKIRRPKGREGSSPSFGTTAQRNG